MTLSRRGFLHSGAGAAALTLLAGCEKSPWTYLPGWQEPLTDNQPFQPASGAKVDLVAHVLLRTSYGLRGSDYARVRKLGATPEAAVAAYLEEQLKPESLDDKPVQNAVRRLEVLQEPLAELYEYKDHLLQEQLLRATVLRATYSRRQLYEVMVQFWTDHFNIDCSKGECKWLKAADDREVIRRYALGKFPDLLRASALSPAMLWYLDGRENRKQDNGPPNENYARELLELHTLGVHGGYTQQDVMEVARCLTGWTVRGKKQLRKGVVEFNVDVHDDGAKTVLGESIPAGLGAGDLDRVLALVTKHPATASHIATKLCRRFIADEPPADAVNAVAATFTASDGDVPITLRALFATAAFQNSRGNKLRRPFEYIVAALRCTQADTRVSPSLLEYLTRMGHAPFHYPTPDGYPQEAAPWLNTLLWRWNFAVALTEGRLDATVDAAALQQQAGGTDGVMAAALGRLPTEAERQAYQAAGNGLALLLAAPAFQYC